MQSSCMMMNENVAGSVGDNPLQASPTPHPTPPRPFQPFLPPNLISWDFGPLQNICKDNWQYN